MVCVNACNIHKALVTAVCVFAFLWQLSTVAKEWLVPTQSTMSVEETDLDVQDFPVLFKICPNPGFNLKTLNEEGYRLIQHYFSGQSMYNSSHYGWAGHYDTDNSPNYTVKGTKQKLEH